MGGWMGRLLLVGLRRLLVLGGDCPKFIREVPPPVIVIGDDDGLMGFRHDDHLLGDCRLVDESCDVPKFVVDVHLFQHRVGTEPLGVGFVRINKNGHFIFPEGFGDTTI